MAQSASQKVWAVEVTKFGAAAAHTLRRQCQPPHTSMVLVFFQIITVTRPIRPLASQITIALLAART